MPFISHEETLKKHLADPGVAAAYLNECIEDGNEWLIADALKIISELHGMKKSRSLLHQIEKLKADFAPAKIRLRFEAVPQRNGRKTDAKLLPAVTKPLRAAPKRTRKVAA